jgi:hypothetical protein
MLLALDISTSCIGYTTFDSEGTMAEIGYVKMNSKKNYWERLDAFMKEVSHMKGIEHIAIEEPLQSFEGRKSNPQTIAKLNFFNGMVSSAVYNYFGIEPVHLNVLTIRATAFPGLIKRGQDKSGKMLVWERVTQLEPQLDWKYGPRSRKLLDENFDMADSYAVGLCMLVMLDDQMS